MKSVKKYITLWNKSAEKIQAPMLFVSEASKGIWAEDALSANLITVKQGSEIECLVEHYYYKKKHKKQWVEQEGYRISLAIEEENIEVDDILTEDAVKTLITYQEVFQLNLDEKDLIKHLLKLYSDFVIDAMVDGVLGDVFIEDKQEFVE